MFHKLSKALIMLIMISVILNIFKSPSSVLSENGTTLKPVFTTCWNADGTKLVAGHTDGTITILDNTGTILNNFPIEGAFPLVSILSCHPVDPTKVYVVTSTSTTSLIYLVDISTQSTTEALSATSLDLIYALSLSEVNDYVAISGAHHELGGDLYQLEVWDIVSNQLVETFEESAVFVDWTSTGNQLISMTFSDQEVRIRNTQTWGTDTAFPVEISGGISGYELRQDDTTLAIGFNTRNPELSSRIDLWNLSTETRTLSLTVGRGIEDISWSPDGQYLAIADTGNLYVWDTVTEELYDIRMSTLQPVLLVDWSPDNGQLALDNESGIELVDTDCLFPVGDGSVPVMISPCETVEDSIWPTYSWWAADGADWYNVYVGDAATHTQNPFGLGGVWVEAAQVCNGDICEFHPTDGLEGTSPNYFGLADNTYDWSLRSLDSSTGTLSDWQPNQAFEVVNPVPTPIEPSGSSTVETGFPTFTWTLVPEADFYEIWAGSQDDTTYVYEWLAADAVCEDDRCRYQTRDINEYLKSNLHNGFYKWYVRSYNSRAGIMGEWQGTNFMMVPPIIINRPAIDSATAVVNLAGRQQVTITWQESVGGDSYRIWIYDAAQQTVYNPDWIYHEDVCVDGVCSLTAYFDGAGRDVYLGASNPGEMVLWSEVYPLTVIEPSGEMLAAGQPPDVSVLTPDGMDTDITTDEFVPPSTLEPPDIIQTYPDICGDNPLCDSPFGE